MRHSIICVQLKLQVAVKSSIFCLDLHLPIQIYSSRHLTKRAQCIQHALLPYSYKRLHPTGYIVTLSIISSNGLYIVGQIKQQVHCIYSRTCITIMLFACSSYWHFTLRLHAFIEHWYTNLPSGQVFFSLIKKYLQMTNVHYTYQDIYNNCSSLDRQIFCQGQGYLTDKVVRLEASYIECRIIWGSMTVIFLWQIYSLMC